jgi:hypothetical protein
MAGKKKKKVPASRKRLLKTILGTAAGVAGGYLFYRFIGCRGGG